MSRDGCSRTKPRFSIFWATSALMLEWILPKCSRRIRGAIFLCILNVPQNGLVANNFRFAVQRVLGYVVPPLLKGVSPKARAEAFGFAVEGSLWIAIVAALFGRNSPLALTESNILTRAVYPSPRFLWTHWACWFLVLICQLKPLQSLLLRLLITFGRIDRRV
jgi:hypothetical protein